MNIDVRQETDGRWLADFTAIPGVMAYGASADEAREAAWELALQVVAERVFHGERVPCVGAERTRPDHLE